MLNETCPVIKEFCDGLIVHLIKSGTYKGGSLLWCADEQRDPVYMDYCPRKLPELEGREKIRRIQHLKELGLNCPEYMVIRKPSDTELLKKYPRWSIRSFPTIGLKISTSDLLQLKEFKALLEPSIVPPHAPSISTTLAIPLCKAMLKLGYYPMPCPVIDPKDAQWAGCAIRTPKGVTLEIAVGPVMVRKVSRDGEIDVKYKNITKDKLKLLDNILVKTAILEILQKVPVGFVLELSWYNVPVGYQDSHLIFWDIMPSNKYMV